MKAEPRAFVDALPEGGAEALVMWARIVERFCFNALSLARVPFEMIAAEDECLGIAETTVFCPGDASLAPTVVEQATLLGTGRPAKLSIKHAENDIQPNQIVVRVGLVLPPKTPFGVCSFRLRNGNSRHDYIQPFGVPGRRR